MVQLQKSCDLINLQGIYAYVTLDEGVEMTSVLRKELIVAVRENIGASSLTFPSYLTPTEPRGPRDPGHVALDSNPYIIDTRTYSSYSKQTKNLKSPSSLQNHPGSPVYGKT